MGQINESLRNALALGAGDVLPLSPVAQQSADTQRSTKSAFCSRPPPYYIYLRTHHDLRRTPPWRWPLPQDPEPCAPRTEPVHPLAALAPLAVHFLRAAAAPLWRRRGRRGRLRRSGRGRGGWRGGGGRRGRRSGGSADLLLLPETVVRRGALRCLSTLSFVCLPVFLASWVLGFIFHSSAYLPSYVPAFVRISDFRDTDSLTRGLDDRMRQRRLSLPMGEFFLPLPIIPHNLPANNRSHLHYCPSSTSPVSASSHPSQSTSTARSVSARARRKRRAGGSSALPLPILLSLCLCPFLCIPFPRIPFPPCRIVTASYLCLRAPSVLRTSAPCLLIRGTVQLLAPVSKHAKTKNKVLCLFTAFTVTASFVTRATRRTATRPVLPYTRATVDPCSVNPCSPSASLSCPICYSHSIRQLPRPSFAARAVRRTPPRPACVHVGPIDSRLSDALSRSRPPSPPFPLSSFPR